MLLGLPQSIDIVSSVRYHWFWVDEHISAVSFLLIIASSCWIILNSQAFWKARHIDFLIMSGNGELSKFLNPFKRQGLFRSDKTRHCVEVVSFCVETVLSATIFCPESVSSLHNAVGGTGRGDNSRDNSRLMFLSIFTPWEAWGEGFLLPCFTTVFSAQVS